MAIESFTVYQIIVFGPIRRCRKLDDLPDRDAQCVYSTEKAIAFLGSPCPKLPFNINIALVETRYHCDRKLLILPNYHIRPYTAMQETRWFAGPWRSVRLQHRESDCICRFSIPIATFWYKHCFDANTVPLWSKASNFTKLPYSALYGGTGNSMICRTVTLSAFIAPRKRLHF